MWKETTLGEICEFVRGPFGGSLKKNIFVKEGYAVYEQQHAIKNQCKNFRYYINQEKFLEMQRFIVKSGDILMSCSGTIGKTTIVPADAPVGIINQALLKITTSNVLNVHFLKFYMQSKLFHEQLMETVDGAAIKNVASVKILKNITINLPPLAEQERIVAKLDATFAEIDEAISVVEVKEIEVQKLKASLLSSFFSDDTVMWRETTLGEHYDVRDGTHDSPKYIQDGFPLVTSKNLKNGKIDLTKVKYISKEDYEDINRRSGVSLGDVLMAMIGTIGNPVEIIEPPEFAIKNVALFKTNDEQSPAFLFYFLSHPHTISKMMADAKGATQKFVGLGYLRSFPILVPPLEVQEQIVEKLKAVYAEVKNANESILKIKTNYQTLKSAILAQELQSSEAA